MKKLTKQVLKSISTKELGKVIRSRRRGLSNVMKKKYKLGKYKTA